MDNSKKDLSEPCAKGPYERNDESDESDRSDDQPMRSIFCHVTTTGNPTMKAKDIFYSSTKLEFYDTSRLTGLTYIIYDNQTRYIENAKDHNITNNTIVDILKAFNNDLDGVVGIYGFDVDFIVHILLSECHRIGYDDLRNTIKKLIRKCVKKIGRKFIKNNDITLQTLYCSLFKKDCLIESNIATVKICNECYMEMTRKPHKFNKIMKRLGKEDDNIMFNSLNEQIEDATVTNEQFSQWLVDNDFDDYVD